ncbi:serine/threonine dehydratase [Phytoactinopolyspora mesophila]|uniref:threonine ammonia-lyase n=1 Tax=Phytoactinopolyspora mesophila TaxID=2650750 RepID=A0A7K3MBB4_9ACTN|nr:pyridoxal-phosphate dependent enzyme [Phytoactinopolyspora mesophila]
MIDVSDVKAARARLRGHIRTTPVFEIDPAHVAPAARVWFKLEQLQHTGSFKVRGAFNRIRTAIEEGQLVVGGTGVIAASGGNAGLAVAYAAAEHGVTAQVYVPETAPPVKVKKLRALGADVRQVGTKYADAYETAIQRAEETDALFCHAYDQPEICAGQGTIGLEIAEQTGGAADTVLVAVGGGGLLAGIAAALEGQARVVGVEPSTAPTLNTALASGGPVDVGVSGVAADSLGASRLGGIAYDVAVRTGVGSVLVDDAHIVEARRRLWTDYRIVVEHGPATAAAALFSGAYQPTEGERIVVVLSGANTDPSDLV